MRRRRQGWTKWLTSADRVEVRFETVGRDVTHFSVQYLAEFESTWHPVVRFDTAHGAPHMDVMWPTGNRETRDLKGLDNRDALTYALGDIDSRWEFYRERYERELK